MSIIPEPFKKGGGFITTQGDCKHSGHWEAWLVVGSEVLVDGSVVDSGSGVGNRFPIGPGGTLGRFLPLGTSDNYVK